MTGTSLGHLAIRAPNWVGDLCMATPILEAALEDPRFERVSIVVRAHLVDVLADGPCAGHLRRIEDDREEMVALRELRPDAVLLLSNSFGAAWRAWRARVAIRAGARMAWRGLFLTHRVAPPTRHGRSLPIPTAHLMRDIAGLLGISVPSLRPRLYTTAGAGAASRALLAGRGLGPGEEYAVCVPGAAFGQAKLWPPERFAAALDLLREAHGLAGVVTGGPGEEPLIEAVSAAARHAVISLAGEPRDLAGLKPLIADARLLLVGDSGPRWYAAAFDVPCVSVMGPNSPERTASSLEWCEIVRHEDLACSPCLERVCPLGHHRCMQDLPVERVVAAAERLLARAAVSPVR